MKVKSTLCELLSEVHAELGASQYGRHVNAKLRVTDYVKNKQVCFLFEFLFLFFLQRWEMNQKGETGNRPGFQQKGNNQQRKRKQPRNNNSKRVKTE